MISHEELIGKRLVVADFGHNKLRKVTNPIPGTGDNDDPERRELSQHTATSFAQLEVGEMRDKKGAKKTHQYHRVYVVEIKEIYDVIMEV